MDKLKLKVVSVADALFTALSEAIYNLEYNPGQQITETEIAERFNVSRNTVRETTVRLINCGLLNKEANKGIFVKKIGEKDVREVFRFRAMLECEAVRCIIRNGRRIPKQLITSVENIQLNPSVRYDWYQSVRPDLDFHLELVRASQSVRLLRLYETIRYETMLCMCQSKNSNIVNPKNLSDHRLFIEMLKTGTEDGTVAMVQRHIEFGIENVAKCFSEVEV
jgi:DNA-binding GntR family transcriptional regulator